MDDHQIQIVITTWDALSARHDAFSTAFYERLFARDATLRPMFPHDMAAQRVKLVDELSLIVHALSRVPDVVERATVLGHRHAGYGVVPAHYELMLDVLIDALRDVLGAEMDESATLAWRRAYHLVSELMLNGAEYGPAIG